MKVRHSFRQRAAQADVAAFHTSAASLKAITPPLIPMQLHHTPEQMGDGDEMDFAMWLSLPLLFGFWAWKTRRLLEGVAG